MHLKFLFTATRLLASILFIVNPAFSQNTTAVGFGKISSADFNLTQNAVIDSNANGVIIANVGSIEFIGNKNNWVSYVYKKSTRLRILNKKGFDMATVKIKLFGQNERQDNMNDFHASTYNIESGKVVETKLNNSDLFSETLSKNIVEKKFTMPDIKEGSIIEYSYTITSYHYYDLPVWYFQSLSYPCLYSEFKISVPDLLRYLTVRYGIDSFDTYKSDEGHKTLVMASVNVSSVIHNHTWVMKNISPFKAEDYIYEPSNYLDKLEFSLAQTYNGENVENIRTTWKDAEDQLLESLSFGKAINVEYASNLYNAMQRVCSSDDDIRGAATHIYNYVRDNFICVPDNDILISDLYEINKLHRGSVAELNMLLIALLRQRGIRADPVILSTKDFGNHPETYPILEKMNYVICMMHAGTDTIYLDASDPILGFGKLRLSCYNGHARIINEQHSGSLYFYPNAIKQESKTYITIVNDENDNGSSGSFESDPGYFECYDLRNTIKEKGKEAYFTKLKSGYGDGIEIKNLQIDSLKQLEQQVKINYDINFKRANEDDIIYFNPFISDAFKENPFKATERKYPVEMPYPLDDTYELTMDIPKGYKVEELPKSVKVSFNGTDGFFEYTIQKDESMVQLRSHVKLNQATFAPEDYNSLRDFFAYVVKKQSEQIVFKRK